MTVEQSIAYENVNMIRMLDWRWTLATRLVEERWRLSQIPDPCLRAAVQYQQATAAGHWIRRSRRGVHFEAIAAAHALHEKESRSRDLVEALLLAGLLSGEIAIELDLSPDMIEAYEALFFQVRDRLQRCRTWVVGQLYGHELIRGLPISFSQMIRMFGFYFGKDAAMLLHRAFPEEQFRPCLEQADIADPNRISIKMIYLMFQSGKESSRLLDLWTDFRNTLRRTQELSEPDADAMVAEAVDNSGLVSASSGLESRLKQDSSVLGPPTPVANTELVPLCARVEPKRGLAA